MKVKIVEQKFIPGNLGGYFRSRCEIFLKGDNVATGVDRQKRIDAAKNYVNRKPDQADHGQKYIDSYNKRRGPRNAR